MHRRETRVADFFNNQSNETRNTDVFVSPRVNHDQMQQVIRSQLQQNQMSQSSYLQHKPPTDRSKPNCQSNSFASRPGFVNLSLSYNQAPSQLINHELSMQGKAVRETKHRRIVT